nr:folate-binding protein [Pseudoclavibacter sp. Marseille-Q3772]
MTTPLAAQRALALGDAVVSLPTVGAISVTGEDRLTLIHSLTTQHVAGLEAGECVENLVLSPQGRIEHQFLMVDDGARTLIASETANELGQWLMRMRFMMRVEVDELSGHIIGTFADPNGRDHAVQWGDPWMQADGISYAKARTAADYPLTLQLVDEVPQGALASETLEGLRIAAWRPRFATEVDERALPHELDLLRSAVHMNKGCYRGQETVAKVHNLGHPPRRLTYLSLDGNVPEHGALIRLDPEGKPVGRITSAATHYEEGPIALALLKRNTPVDVPLSVDDSDAPITAAQTVIVPPDAGSVVSLPPRR